MSKELFLALSVLLLVTSGGMLFSTERYQRSGVAPFAQAPAWALRVVGVAAGVAGLLTLLRFLTT
jgi:uncharacterized protein YjeT (DUF2065 family)